LRIAANDSDTANQAMTLPADFRIKTGDRFPFTTDELDALPPQQQRLEYTLADPQFIGRSVAMLASRSGLTEAQVHEYCESSPHIIRIDRDGKLFYGLLARARPSSQRIFLSYADEDQPLGNRLIRALRASGGSVSTLVEHMLPGVS